MGTLNFVGCVCSAGKIIILILGLLLGTKVTGTPSTCHTVID
jgi:hypothetical protein